VMMLLQTIIQLPFGPLSVAPSREYAELVGRVRAVVVISEFMQRYIRDHGGLEAHLLRMPVYGKGPFPDLARFDSGFVTMINPCELKGVDIFLELARCFPDVTFAAVPTWGASQELLERLRSLPNIRILQASGDIEDILRQTRILLVPSLWPETFGYVAPEAMLRGIPVLASDIGGLPEAKLGVDYVLPVKPGEFGADGFSVPPQDISPWSRALEELLHDEDNYRQCSRRSRQAAHAFVNTISAARFEQLMAELEDQRV
jgi:glycosyltransferase involved in cell wall biosynthesis